MGFPLRHFFGIGARLHYTWLLTFILVPAIVTTQFPENYPLWQRILLGIATAIIFFLAVNLREFILRLVALTKGVHLRTITLFIFGGTNHVAEKAAASQPIEMLLTATGLLTNLIIAVALYVAYLVLLSSGSVAFAGLLLWLAYMFLMLVLFHFIPAYPLDAGRGVRALLCKAIKDYDRATRILSWMGIIFGLIMTAAGIAIVVDTRQWSLGLVLALAGWSLQRAAFQGERHGSLHESLRNITVRNLTESYVAVTRQMKLSDLVYHYALLSGQDYFLVVEDNTLQGVVTLDRIRRVRKSRWHSTDVGRVMTPASRIRIANGNQPADLWLDEMEALKINQVPVVEDGQVAGILTYDRIGRLLRNRTKLRMRLRGETDG